MFPESKLVAASVRSAFPSYLVHSFLRSSRRSRSGIVLSLSFSSFSVASRVALFWGLRLPSACAPRLRHVGELYTISIPVSR